MSQPYVGEIRIFAGTFAPLDWMFCNGALLPIAQYDTLYNLIGTTYGGDGQSTFALPDLRSRVPLHQGGGFNLGQNGGAESVTLSVLQMPGHNHLFMATQNPGSQPSPVGALPAANNTVKLYSADPPAVNLATQALLPAGGSLPHANIQPYLCVNFIISLYGIYPSQQ